ncbi:MAG TPA: hypothetical protein H9784_04625, partial [Candidatus Desulfovibrio intestinavium]|nr:hypothetical protein [Candidatus Desulfovibrio intestinavium]
RETVLKNGFPLPLALPLSFPKTFIRSMPCPATRQGVAYLFPPPAGLRRPWVFCFFLSVDCGFGPAWQVVFSVDWRLQSSI